LIAQGRRPAEFGEGRVAVPERFELVPAERLAFALAAQELEPGGAEEEARAVGIDAEGLRACLGAALGQEIQGGESEKG
jgi:hypothetical protein